MVALFFRCYLGRSTARRNFAFLKGYNFFWLIGNNRLFWYNIFSNFQRTFMLKRLQISFCRRRSFPHFRNWIRIFNALISVFRYDRCPIVYQCDLLSRSLINSFNYIICLLYSHNNISAYLITSLE